MIPVGSVVRGNWSTIEYRVDHAWKAKGKDYWCVNGKAVDNPLASAHFSYLGKRNGNEIEMGGTYPKGDVLIIIKENKPKHDGQMEMLFEKGDE